MPLSDIVIPTKTLSYSGQSFTVHGVTANDVLRMFFEADKDIARILDVFEQATIDSDDADRMIPVVLREAPELAARLIASAADEPAAWPTVARLPVSTQLEALLAVWNLTFEEPDALKKFVASLTTLASSAKTLKEGQRLAVATGGSRESAAMSASSGPRDT